jgi:hypothetical protein
MSVSEDKIMRKENRMNYVSAHICVADSYEGHSGRQFYTSNSENATETMSLRVAHSEQKRVTYIVERKKKHRCYSSENNCKAA